MINVDEVMTKSRRRYIEMLAEECGISYANHIEVATISKPFVSPQIESLVSVLVDAINKELEANSLKLGPAIQAAKLVDAVSKQQIPILPPQMTEPGPVKVVATEIDVTKVSIVPGVKTVPVDTKGQKTPCFEPPGARGTTVVP